MLPAQCRELAGMELAGMEQPDPQGDSPARSFGGNTGGCLRGLSRGKGSPTPGSRLQPRGRIQAPQPHRPATTPPRPGTGDQLVARWWHAALPEQPDPSGPAAPDPRALALPQSRSSPQGARGLRGPRTIAQHPSPSTQLRCRTSTPRTAPRSRSPRPQYLPVPPVSTRSPPSPQPPQSTQYHPVPLTAGAGGGIPTRQKAIPFIGAQRPGSARSGPA